MRCRNKTIPNPAVTQHFLSDVEYRGRILRCNIDNRRVLYGQRFCFAMRLPAGMLIIKTEILIQKSFSTHLFFTAKVKRFQQEINHSGIINIDFRLYC